LIFRIGSIGDTCVAIPAFKLVRKRFPDSNIRVLTNFPVGNGIKAAPLQSVIGDSGLVDGYFEYPLGDTSFAAASQCAVSLKKWQPDMLIYMMPQRSNLQLVRDYIFFRFVVGIPSIIGISLHRASQRPAWNKGKQLYDSEASRILRNLIDLGAIDIADPVQWDLGVEKQLIQSGNRLDFFQPVDLFLACSVGTKVDTKHWGEDRWKEWAQRLSAELPTLTLVLFGASIEFDESERVARSWGGPTINVCGKLTPRESAAFLRKAIAFVGHDSGPMHLAASVGTPCVAIFSAQEMPGIWFPFGTGHQVFYRQTACAGCRLEVCTEYRKKCIRSITVDEIFTATHNLILKQVVTQKASA
jgi:ADP-heptose:LPS heptosyltransferase